jgi:hypothetical protein
MPGFFVVNTQAKNQQRTMHRASCGHLPKIRNQVGLGWRWSVSTAYKAAAAKGLTPIHLCAFCCGTTKRRRR